MRILRAFRVEREKYWNNVKNLCLTEVQSVFILGASQGMNGLKK
jgi:hypothetical protein